MAQTLTERLLAAQPDAKAAMVIKAGLDVFLQHGLRRTSMQDIAARAGMSRAALYLHFRNKEDIYQALMRGYFNARAEVVEDVLSSNLSPTQALSAAFDAQLGDLGEALLRSTHGGELLSSHHNADLLAEGELALAQVYGRWIEVGVIARQIAPAAVAGNGLRTAQAMLAGFEGLRPLAHDWPGYLDARRRLVLIYVQALFQPAPRVAATA